MVLCDLAILENWRYINNSSMQRRGRIHSEAAGCHPDASPEDEKIILGEQCSELTTAVEQARPVVFSRGTPLARRRAPTSSDRFRDDGANAILAEIVQITKVSARTTRPPIKGEAKGYPSGRM
ncbi:hypothetical protein WMF20_26660 [Sorangium sp. So ce834]|uniref:hypothetical protein n=1 Tax=Sorangium sp. So ce834 TaxID=3133321 RepID=UPI003F611CD2